MSEDKKPPGTLPGNIVQNAQQLREQLGIAQTQATGGLPSTTAPGHGAAPAQPQPQQFVAQPQQPFGAQPQPQPQQFGAQPQQPFGAQPQPQQFGAQPQPQPFGAQQPQPFGAQQPQPFGAQQPQPFGAQQFGAQQPFGAQPARAGAVQAPQPHGQPQQPYGPPQPYGQPQQPHGAPPQPYGQPQQPYPLPTNNPPAPRPWPEPPPPQPQPLPYAQALTPRRTHLAQAVKPPTGTGFIAMAILSLKRAFRLHIDANEVLDDERAAMLAARPAITDESQQAFLAWRRSILFVAALLMIPVAIVHVADDLKFEDGTPEIWKQLSYVQVVVEIGFALFLWTQVGKWRSWRTQSRRLALGWLLYFLTPFLVFLYPLASAVDYRQMDPATAHATKIAVGMAIGAQAFLSLAPKIISLLQGLIRASIATKTLFPGASAPGWMMVIAAPLYMIIFYVFVLLPYHFTGEPLVVIGTLLVLSAKGTLVRAGLRLTRPMTDATARHATHRAQMIWMTLLIAGIAFIVGGLWELVSKASPLSVLNFGLSMGANILLLTLIATDTIISGLDRARGVTPEESALAAEVQQDIAAFTALRD
ncbi:MAG: proline-rich domain-containing protein [Kofleriaceae bacterium]